MGLETDSITAASSSQMKYYLKFCFTNCGAHQISCSTSTPCTISPRGCDGIKESTVCIILESK